MVNRSRKYKMKDSIGVMDHEWCAYVILLKENWAKAQGSRLKTIISNGAKTRISEWNKGLTCPFDLF